MRGFRIISAMLLGGAALLGAVSTAADFHERKEIAGLAFVFGAEPEPALHDEIQFLRWRVTTLADGQPYGSLTDAEVRITRGGQQFGPFELRPVRGTPGQYETRHIFTQAGDYGSVLTFKKGQEPTAHSIDFAFTINDRGSIEIP